MGDDVLIGDHLGGYRVTGGGGERGYSAVHRHTGRRVQLFVARTGAARELFERTRMFEALPHPGIARVVDRGVLADHRAWLAIDVPNGLPLFELVARRPLPSAEVSQLVHDVADVLAFAHERGIAHGSLTLRSVVVTTGARAFPIAIVDFGIVVGDAAGDIAALGTIAYRAVTQLFPTATVEAVPGATPELAELIIAMLSREPSERPTAAAVRAAAAAPIADDHAHAPPRWSAPRWTPAPPITSDARATVSGEIVTTDRER
jgi:hypothetical protein